MRLLRAVAGDLDAVRLATDTVRELPERRARPAARVEQPHRLSW
jgi:hypothetical protein